MSENLGPTNRSEIRAFIRQKIASGEWPIGFRVPSRRELAGMFNVAVNTVQLAISDLSSESLLEARGKLGTFVINCPCAVQGGYSSDSGKAPVAVVIAVVNKPQRYNEDTVYFQNWEMMVVDAFERRFSSLGGSCVPVISESAAGLRAEQIRSVDPQKADSIAVIQVIGGSDSAERIHQCLKQSGLASVIVSASPVKVIHTNVFYDQFTLGYRAVEHMSENGYDSILAVFPRKVKWMDERLKGVEYAARALSIPLQVVPDKRVKECLYDYPEWGRIFADELLKEDFLKGKCPAIVAANDRIALGILECLEEKRLEAGRDFGLIGFDNIPRAQQFGLSSLMPPLEELGKAAAETLYDKLKGESSVLQIRLTAGLFAHIPTYPEKRVGTDLHLRGSNGNDLCVRSLRVHAIITSHFKKDNCNIEPGFFILQVVSDPFQIRLLS